MPPTSLLLDAYLGVFLVLGVYGLHRVSLLLRFRWGGAESAGSTRKPISEAAARHVTVQLPLYNERTVARRLIRAVGRLEWPLEKLEIQVLDDSTDETRGIVDEEVAALCAQGLDASVVRRVDRVGYKAGALAAGTARAKGELLCVFDADFLPRKDFLLSTVPAFDDGSIGMVQARWEHVNREESALTRAQSTLLDGHFVIEHKVRHDHGLFFNFNGTAGIWRRSTIEDAGGWMHDTLTEDLDLSYRAQLAGWRFRYLHLVGAPAEIPPDIAAFKSQQHRWAKGSVQVARKLAPRILRADLPLRVKLEAMAHLLGNTGHPALLLFALLLPLAVEESARLAPVLHVPVFLLCTVSVLCFYERSQRALGRGLLARVADVPAALALGIGMSVSQTRAVLEGAFGGLGEFVRTPKRGNGNERGYRLALRGLPGVELLLAAWIAWAMVGAVRAGTWSALPFLTLFLWGFAWVGFSSLRLFLRAAR